MTKNVTQPRSSSFFVSDLNNAAEDAALAMKDYGLSDSDVEDLSEQITTEISQWFSAWRDRKDQEYADHFGPDKEATNG